MDDETQDAPVPAIIAEVGTDAAWVAPFDALKLAYGKSGPTPPDDSSPLINSGDVSVND